MITADTRNRWRFFLEHAGYATPPGRAACALELARAEQLFEEAEGLGVATSEVLDDEHPYDFGDEVSVDEPRFGVVVEVGDELESVNDPRHASLWGIAVGPEGEQDPYLRVIRAELASELRDELRQAVGDAGRACLAARGGVPMTRPETYCDVCGRRDSWGCGHTGSQRRDARRHNATRAHREGRCWHYDHSACGPKCQPARDRQPRTGWLPLVTHASQAAGGGS